MIILVDRFTGTASVSDPDRIGTTNPAGQKCPPKKEKLRNFLFEEPERLF
jgi:hypothetical protein